MLGTHSRLRDAYPGGAVITLAVAILITGGTVRQIADAGVGIAMRNFVAPEVVTAGSVARIRQLVLEPPAIDIRVETTIVRQDERIAGGVIRDGRGYTMCGGTSPFLPHPLACRGRDTLGGRIEI